MHSGAIAETAQRSKTRGGGSWRKDETSVKVKGQWNYLTEHLSR